ncbi:rhodanese [Anaerobacillus alkalidiazotrophicus]|uniref:Rhodanese n=1 Tax=Anaerobacillus alkalidiazotrophicus TaxID=472963 RepID=A0A1S2M3X9_9BACI|nr:rhodanese [Anaerobacillus alkalidiazotrophicus]
MKKYFHFILLFLLLLLFFGYKQFQAQGIEQINTDQLAEMLESDGQNDVFYIDVREPHEFQDGHINGMVNVPLSQLENNYDIIPKEKTVVIFCRSGNRSLQAANILKDIGYKDLVNVKGGILDWKGEVVK